MITFVIPCSNVLAYGVRTMSSYLKSKGHKVQMIFIVVDYNKFGKILSDDVISQLVELTKDSKLIAMPVMINYLLLAQQISKALKKTNIPIMWGGIHPTLDPESCFEFADMVCVGEGEDPVLELANSLSKGIDYKIPNIWFKKDGQIIKNEIRELNQDLDKLPMPDYDLSTEYILENGKFVKMTEKSLKDNLYRMDGLSRYSVFSTRGCPHSCAFCCNAALKDLYKGKGKFIRKRDLKLVLDEIEEMKNRFNFESVCIQDENFFVRSEEEIREFATQYKERVGLPFQVEFSPQMFHEPKMKLLIDAGLRVVGMGVQTGCDKTNKEIYNRFSTKQGVSNVVDFFRQYDQIKFQLHFLLYNPWEDNQSLVETIQFAFSMPSQFSLIIYPLCFYPGTKLYEMAKRDGYVKNTINDVVMKGWGLERLNEANYLVICFYALRYLRTRLSDRNTKRMMNLLLNKRMIYVFDRKLIMKPVGSLLSGVFKMIK